MNYDKSWDDYTALEQAAITYSDYHKDVRGFRPRNDQSKWTEEDYDREMKVLAEEMLVVMNSDKQRQDEAIAKFEGLIESAQGMCNCSRTQAWDFIKQAEGDDWHDAGYFEYEFGLPYGYLKFCGFETESNFTYIPEVA